MTRLLSLESFPDMTRRVLCAFASCANPTLAHHHRFPEQVRKMIVAMRRAYSHCLLQPKDNGKRLQQSLDLDIDANVMLSVDHDPLAAPSQTGMFLLIFSLENS